MITGSFDFFNGSLDLASQPRFDAALSGTFLRVVEAPYDFFVALDNGSWMPMGAGRSLEPKDADGRPQRFSTVSFRVDPAVAIVGNTVPFRLVYGDIGYDDQRVAILPKQTVRIAGAARVVGANYVWADGGLGYMQIAGQPSQYCINVRNTDAVNPLRVGFGDLGPADVAALVAGGGALLLPGENEDFDVGSTANWGEAGPLWVRAAAGTTFTVTHRCYRV